MLTESMLNLFQQQLLECLNIWYDEDIDKINEFIDNNCESVYKTLLSKIYYFDSKNGTMNKFNTRDIVIHNEQLDEDTPFYKCTLIKENKEYKSGEILKNNKDFFTAILSFNACAELDKYSHNIKSIPFILEFHYRILTATIMTGVLLSIKDSIISNLFIDNIGAMLTSTMLSTVWHTIANCDGRSLGLSGIFYPLSDNYNINKEIICDVIYNNHNKMMGIANCEFYDMDCD